MLRDGLATADGRAALDRLRATHLARYGDRFRTATPPGQ